MNPSGGDPLGYAVVGPPAPRRKLTVEEAKALLLADEPADPSPFADAAAHWTRSNPMRVVIGAAVTGILLGKSRLLRRAVMAGLLAPALRREAMKIAADLVRAVISPRA